MIVLYKKNGGKMTLKLKEQTADNPWIKKRSQNKVWLLIKSI